MAARSTPRQSSGTTNSGTTTMVHVRVDEQVKEQAKEALAAMGLSVSDAVRVFLIRIATEKQLPFTLKVPNTETLAAMEEADEIVRTRCTRFAIRSILHQSSRCQSLES